MSSFSKQITLYTTNRCYHCIHANFPEKDLEPYKYQIRCDEHFQELGTNIVPHYLPVKKPHLTTSFGGGFGDEWPITIPINQCPDFHESIDYQQWLMKQIMRECN